jgi:glycosyltransferase involved in cell wall biosynthesis
LPLNSGKTVQNISWIVGNLVKKSILVVGQIPPPVNGQTIAIQAFVEGRYDTLDIHLVEMKFSKAIDEVGRFQLRKILVLFGLVVRILAKRFTSRASVLYYPPAGPNTIPVLRDIFTLVATRWLFRYTVFHFHAAGLPEIYPRLPRVLRPLFRLAYQRPDLAIITTRSTSAGAELEARKIVVIPCGVADSAANWVPKTKLDSPKTFEILFMGILCEGKGLITLIDACVLLHQAGLVIHVTCAGAFETAKFREQVETLVTHNNLADVISFPGVLTGQAKIEAFEQSDVFCFPSHYHSESFGIVLIEAMSFGLPIVTTRWRGIPDVVEGCGGAFVVEPKSPGQVRDRLVELYLDEDLRRSMGANNRRWFLANYTLQQYRAGLEAALSELDSTAVQTELLTPTL